MRIVIDLFIVVCSTIRVGGTETYFFEKLNHFGLGLGRRAMPMPNVFEADTAAHPKPLPPDPPSRNADIPTPYKSLYQGIKAENDTRVFRKRFDFEPEMSGHQVLCKGLFDCTLTHLAIETSEAIPIIVRGGAGYRHFSVVVRAKPGYPLKGIVRAYCSKKDLEDSPALRKLVEKHNKLYTEK